MTSARWLMAPILAAAMCGSAAAWISGPFIIFFDFGSHGLTPPARAILDNLVEAMRAVPGHLVIEGHTDRAGESGYNRLLACRRARAAHAYLLVKGIAPERMAVRALGEDQPMVDTGDGAREPQNRRVQFLSVNPLEAARARSESNC